VARLPDQMMHGHWKLFDQSGQGAGASQWVNRIGTPVYLHEPAPLLICELLVTQGSGGIGKDLCHKSRIIQHPHHDTLEMVMTHARMAPH